MDCFTSIFNINLNSAVCCGPNVIMKITCVGVKSKDVDLSKDRVWGWCGSPPWGGVCAFELPFIIIFFLCAIWVLWCSNLWVYLFLTFNYLFLVFVWTASHDIACLSVGLRSPNFKWKTPGSLIMFSGRKSLSYARKGHCHATVERTLSLELSYFE